MQARTVACFMVPEPTAHIGYCIVHIMAPYQLLLEWFLKSRMVYSMKYLIFGFVL
jgi:hypothetical protein